MAKAIYNGVDNVARKVKTPYIGVDNVSRKAKNAYIGVDNVARECISSEVVWGKYSCEVDTYYVERDMVSGYGSIGDSLGMRHPFSQVGTQYHSYPYYKGYSFSRENGYEGQGNTTVAIEGETAETLTNLLAGYYYVGSEIVIKITSITELDTANKNYKANGTIVGLAVGPYSHYYQGLTSYGTITAEEGELPEVGTLVNGSVDEGYCVLKIGFTYYYYVLEG